MKNAMIIIWLIPFGCLVSVLDAAAKICKWGYKAFHAAGTVVSVYIRDVMDKNNL